MQKVLGGLFYIIWYVSENCDNTILSELMKDRK